MAERQIIVVSEVAPRLRELKAEAAKTFLREYRSYENRLGPTEVKMLMKRCMEPLDLDTLLDLTHPLRGYTVIRELPAEGPQREKVRTEVLSPIVPRNLIETLNEDIDDDEDEMETIPEGIPVLLYMSNAHIEAMLLQELGPQSDEESTDILKRIRMDPEAVPYSSLVLATTHVREWKDALQWCAAHLPRQRSLVKLFLEKIYPRKLASALEIDGCRKIKDCMAKFIMKYRKGVAAKKDLFHLEDAPRKPKAEPATPIHPRAEPRATPKVEGKPVAKDPATAKSTGDWRASKQCFHCGKMGHIQPDCPSKKAGEPKSHNTITLSGSKKNKPYLAVDVCACGDQSERTLRLMAHMDSGSELEGVGQNMVSYLEMHGGVVESLSVPQVVNWSDKGVTREAKSIIKMHFKIAGSEIQGDLTFFIFPWDTDYLVFGWEAMSKHSITKRLDDLLLLQHAQGLSTGMSNSDGNRELTDMDERVMSTDQLLFADEPEPESPPSTSVLTPVEQKEIDELLEKYSDVFLPKPAGSAKVEPMAVTFKEGYKAPPMEPFRSYSPRVEAAIEADLKKQLDLGVVEPSLSDSGCPVHAVPKPDSESGYRFTVDFRPLNSGVVTDSYPLPSVSEVLTSLRDARYTAKMDLKWGYWQFPVRPSDRQYLTFFWKGKIYQYCVAPMGYVQSGFHVQRCMARLFAKSFARGIIVYIDDIIVYGKDWGEFKALLTEAFDTLLDSSLFLKREKCAFGVRELHVLGHVVSRDGLRSATDRIDAVRAVPFPRNVHELRRFLGMTNYMRDYIPQYSMLAKPLSRQVNNPLGEWPRREMGEAFEALKDAVSSQLSLAHLNYSVPLVVQCDASTLGVAGAVINRYPEGDRVIKCVSHAFTEAESKWKTLEQETFAIVFTLCHFRGILIGHYFIVETDHRNIIFVHSGTSAKVVRWSLSLQQFSFGVSFLPGAKNVVADTLSRAPMGAPLSVGAIRLSDFEAAPGPRRVETLRGVVSPIPEQRAWFDAAHNETVGHMGVHATLRMLQGQGRVWSRMSRDVTDWIASCPLCQKYRLGGKEIISIPSPIASFQIFEELGVDFIGPLPRDDVGNSYICNCVCMTTHYCELFAVEAASAVIAAHCLLSVVARYGCFRSVRSDRGTHFVNEVISEFLRLFEIQQVLTLAERPQANAIVERNGAEVMRHLRILLAPKDLRSIWSVMLPLSQRIINRTWKAAIGSSPHCLIHWAPTDLDRGLFSPIGESKVIPPLANDYVLRLQGAYERLLDETSMHILKEQEKLREDYKGVEPTEFEVGAYVLLSYIARAPSKLAARWAGPYRIVSRRANSAELEDLTGGPSKTVDVSRLKHFIVAPGVDVKAVAAADLGEAQVEAILAHRGSARKRTSLEFQVQWSDGDVTWEPWDRVKKLSAIDEYIRAYPGPELKSLLQK